MIYPSIHLNGSSPERLLEPLEKAAHSLQDALEALREATPHGRDYYVQPEGALREAENEHARRLRAIGSVLEEIDALRLYLQDKIYERKR